MSEIKLKINVYAQGEYGKRKTSSCTMQLLVSEQLLVTSLVEQIITQIDPRADYTKFGIILSGMNKWLVGHNPISYYKLKNGDALDLCCKHEQIKIKTLDGSLRTVLVDETNPVGTIVEGICNKMGISNYEEYGLVLERSVKRKKYASQRSNNQGGGYNLEDGILWLRSSRLLREQGAFEPDASITLKRRFFFSYDIPGPDDVVQLNLLYGQVQSMVIEGKFPCTLPEACMFAAAQLQIEVSDYNEAKSLDSLTKLHRYVASEFVKAKNAKKMIIENYKNLAGMSKTEVKMHYIKLARSLGTYGITFFKAAIENPDKTYSRVLLGVTKSAIVIMCVQTKKILNTWPLAHMKRWSVLHDNITIDFGDYLDDYVRLKCTECDAVSELILGYINIVLKRHGSNKKKYTKLNSKAYFGKAVLSKHVRPVYRRQTVSKNTLPNSPETSGADDKIDSVSQTDDQDKTHSDNNMDDCSLGRDDSCRSQVDAMSMDARDPESLEEGIRGSIMNAIDKMKFVGQFVREHASVSAANDSMELSEDGKVGQEKSEGTFLYGIVKVGDGSLIPSQQKDSEKNILIWDICNMLTLTSLIGINLSLVRCPVSDLGVSVNEDEILENTETFIHSHSSFIRSFQIITSGDDLNSKKFRGNLLAAADSFILKNRTLMENIKSKEFLSGSGSSIATHCIQLIQPLSSLLTDMGAKVTGAKHGEVIVNDILLSIDLLKTFEDQVSAFFNDSPHFDTSDAMGELKEVENAICLSKVITASIPSLVPVSDRHQVQEHTEKSLLLARRSMKRALTLLESSSLPTDKLESLRKLAHQYMDKVFLIMQHMSISGNELTNDLLVQFSFVRKNLDALMKYNLNVDEFAEHVNDLSLATVNMFNIINSSNSVQEDKSKLRLLEETQANIGEIYSTVMACAREYAANMTDYNLREELASAVSKLESVMDSVFEGNIECCKFYNLYKLEDALYSNANCLASYAKTLIELDGDAAETSKLESALAKFLESSVMISSSLEAFSSYPTKASLQVRLRESSVLLLKRSSELVDSTSESFATLQDCTAQGILDKICRQVQDNINRLSSAISTTEISSFELKIRSTISVLTEHLNDLDNTRNKVESLSPIEGYDTEVAHNDFYNSFKYSKACLRRLFESLCDSNINKLIQILDHSIRVLKCLAFSTFGVCTATQSTGDRITAIDSIIEYSKDLLALILDIGNSIQTPEILPNIASKHSIKIGNSLVNILRVVRSQKNLLEVSMFAENLNDKTALCEPVELGENDMESVINYAKEKTKELIQVVGEINGVLANDVGQYNSVVQDLREKTQAYVEANKTYMSLLHNIKSDALDLIVEKNSQVGLELQKFAVSVSEFRWSGGDSAPGRRMKCAAGYLRDALDSVDLVLSGRSFEEHQSVSIVREAANSIRKLAENDESIYPLKMGVSSEVNPVVLWRQSLLALSNEATVSVNVLSPLVEMLDRPETICENKDVFAEQIKGCVRQIASYVSKVAESVKIARLVEEGSELSKLNFTSDLFMLKDITTDVVNKIENIDNASNQKIISLARNILSSYSIVHKMCNRVASHVSGQDGDCNTFLSFCREIESIVECIGSNVEAYKKMDNPQAINIVKEKLIGSCPVLQSISNLATSPGTLANEVMILGSRHKVEDTYTDCMYDLSDQAAELLRVFGSCLSNPTPEKVGNVKDILNLIVNTMSEFSNSCVLPAPGIEEYQTIIEQLDQVRSGKCIKVENEKPESLSESSLFSSTKVCSPSPVFKTPESEIIDLTDEFVSSNVTSKLWYSTAGTNQQGESPDSSYNIMKYVDLPSASLFWFEKIANLSEVLLEKTLSGDEGYVVTAKGISLLSSNLKDLSKRQKQLNVEGSDVQSEKIDSLLSNVSALMKCCKQIVSNPSYSSHAAQARIVVENIQGLKVDMIEDRVGQLSKSVSPDILQEVVKSIVNHNPQIQKLDTPVVCNLFGKPIIANKSEYINKSEKVLLSLSKTMHCSEEALEAVKLNEHSTKDKLEDAIQTCLKMSNEVKDFSKLVTDPALLSKIENFSKNSGFIALKLFYLKSKLDETAPANIKKVCEKFVSIQEEYKSFVSLIYDSTMQSLTDIKEHHQFVFQVNEIINSIEEKAALAERGEINPMSSDNNLVLYKSSVMHTSLKFVEKLRSFIEAAKNEPRTSEVVEGAKRAIADLGELRDEVFHLVTSQSALNIDDQLKVLTEFKNVCKSFSLLLENSDMESIPKTFKTKLTEETSKSLLENFEHIRELISCVKESCVEQGPNAVMRILDVSASVPQKMLEKVENGKLADGSGVVMTNVVSASKEFSEFVPKIISIVNDLDAAPQSVLTSVLNKFRLDLQDLCTSAMSRCNHIPKNHADELLEKIKNVCKVSTEFLYAVRKVAESEGKDDDEKSKLKDATRAINMAVASVIQKAEDFEHLGDDSTPKCPGAATERELTSVGGIVKDVCTQLNVFNGSSNEIGESVQNDTPVLVDLNRESRNVGTASLSILRAVATANREFYTDENNGVDKSKNNRMGHNARVELSKKFAFMTINLCQITASISSGDADPRDLIASARVAQSCLNQLTVQAKLSMKLDPQMRTMLNESLSVASRSLKKIITIAGSSGVFDKAEGILSREDGLKNGSLNPDLDDRINASTADLSNPEYDLNVEARLDNKVKSNVEEMNARIKILKMERELEEARRGLVKIRKNLYRRLK